MSTPLIVVLVVLGAALLLGLAWWSSGRTKHRAPGPNPDGDVKHASGYFYRETRGDGAGGGGPTQL